jgi:hypothetical protein
MRFLAFSVIIATQLSTSLAAAQTLKISVSPLKHVLIGPGPASTCLDQQTYLHHGGTLFQSATGPVIVFKNFSLKWTSTERLYVEDIRIKVSGDGIASGSYVQDLSREEVAAILGRADAILDGPAVIASDDPNRPPLYAPCNFVASEIPFAHSPQTAKPFTANVTVTLLGTAISSAGNQRFIEQSIKATAEYYGN